MAVKVKARIIEKKKQGQVSNNNKRIRNKTVIIKF